MQPGLFYMQAISSRKPNNEHDDIHYTVSKQEKSGIRYYQQYKTLE